MAINFKNLIDKNEWRPCAPAASLVANSAIISALNAYNNAISDYRGNNYSNNALYFSIPSGSKGITVYNTIIDSYTAYFNASMVALAGATAGSTASCFVSTLSPRGKITSAASASTLTLDSTTLGGNMNCTWTRSAAVVTITTPIQAVVTASQSTNILTVSAVSSGIIQVGMVLTSGSWASVQTTITGFLTGTGGAGTYLVNTSQTIGSSSVNICGQHYFNTNQRIMVVSTSDHLALPISAIYTATFINNAQYSVTGVSNGATSGTCNIGQSIRANQWADKGDEKGFMIRVIGNSSGGSGKTEERRIIANSGEQINTAMFSGTISTSVLTVTAVAQGTIVPGMLISGTGVTNLTTIVSNGTGSGGIGTYNLSASMTVATAVLITGSPYSVGTTTPTVYLDQPLSFTPQAGDTFELLSGSVFLVGTGSGVANMVHSYDCSTLHGINSLISQRFHLVASCNNAANAYVVQPLPLDPCLVPWNKIPGEGYVTGASTYDTATLTGTDYKNTKGCLLATATTQNITAATTTGSSTSGTILTVGTITGGTIAPGQILVGSTVLPNTIILYNIAGGSANGSTWAISQSQTVSSSALNCYEISLTGQASGGDATVLANQYRNYQIRIVEDTAIPTAVNQIRRIGWHSAGASPKYMLTAAWTVTPSATCKYVIENWQDCILLPQQNTSNGMLTYKVTNFAQDCHQLYDTWSSSATFSNVNVPAASLANYAVHFFGYDNPNDLSKSFRSSFITCQTSVNPPAWATYDISGDFKGIWLAGIKQSYGTLAANAYTLMPSYEYNPHTNNGEEFYHFMHSSQISTGPHAFGRIKGSSGVEAALPPLRAPYGYIGATGWTASTNGYGNRLGLGLYVNPTDPTDKIPALYYSKSTSLYSELYELLLLQ